MSSSLIIQADRPICKESRRCTPESRKYNTRYFSKTGSYSPKQIIDAYKINTGKSRRFLPQELFNKIVLM